MNKIPYFRAGVIFFLICKTWADREPVAGAAFPDAVL